jgi:hypothetical protein
VIFGVIAEDTSDVAVIRELTARLAPDRSIAFKPFVGMGCGRLRRKCKAWAQMLAVKGCSHLIVVHDLDDNDERTLRNHLETAIAAVRFKASVVLIPVREIEAWLLADAVAVQQVFGLPKIPNVPASPERIVRPKETLRDLVWKAGKKRYVNTIHNAMIAKVLRLSARSKCPSFNRYPAFIQAAVGLAGVKGSRAAKSRGIRKAAYR